MTSRDVPWKPKVAATAMNRGASLGRFCQRIRRKGHLQYGSDYAILVPEPLRDRGQWSSVAMGSAQNSHLSRFSGPSVLRLRCETKGPVNALYRELDSTPRVVNCVWPNRKNRKGE